MTKLLYIGDPMCSWCYGFGAELRALLQTLPEFELDILVGGLRAYNSQMMDDGQKEMILGHWHKVAEASGLAFDFEGLQHTNFIYDTEPACRAVVTAKLLADDMPSLAILNVFQALQHGFYAEKKDITQAQVLAEIAVKALNDFDHGNSFDVQSFYETLESPSAKEETRQHFEQIQRWGIRGFPVLLLVKEDGLHMLTSGYTKVENLTATLQQLR